MKSRTRALPLTIVLGSVLIFFCILLTILWNYILIRNYSQIKQYSVSMRDVYLQWLALGIGSFFFVIIIVGVVLFIVFLARQIILNQLQKNFIDSVTHELKTPLTSIKLYIETLKRHNLTKEQKDSFLNIMLKDVERLDILMNHILEATQLENISKNYQLKEIDFEELVKETKDIIIRRYNLTEENFVLDIKNKQIITDYTSLQLVITNLIDNAVKYSSDKIKVEIISYKDNSGKTIITVKDSGVGIPDNEVKKVFRRFYRIQNLYTNEKKGSGLGLFIVKENVKNLKGKIEVFSEGLNKGTTFKIILPAEKLK